MEIGVIDHLAFYDLGNPIILTTYPLLGKIKLQFATLTVNQWRPIGV